MELTTIIIVAVIVSIAYTGWKQTKNSLILKRKEMIRTYRFPKAISEKISAKYPHLDDAQVRMVIRGLKDYFHISNIAGKRMVSMPSQVVDDAWHEFILFTREYQRFCDRALGRFLHHTPAEAMTTPTIGHDGIKRAWRCACKHENIKLNTPHKLPLLFRIDKALNIANGFHYSLNCMHNSNVGDYCAGHMGCGGGCAGEGDSWFSFDSDSSSDSGCGGGCGGD